MRSNTILPNHHFLHAKLANLNCLIMQCHSIEIKRISTLFILCKASSRSFIRDYDVYFLIFDEKLRFQHKMKNSQIWVDPQFFDLLFGEGAYIKLNNVRSVFMVWKHLKYVFIFIDSSLLLDVFFSDFSILSEAKWTCL